MLIFQQSAAPRYWASAHNIYSTSVEAPAVFEEHFRPPRHVVNILNEHNTDTTPGEVYLQVLTIRLTPVVDEPRAVAVHSRIDEERRFSDIQEVPVLSSPFFAQQFPLV